MAPARTTFHALLVNEKMKPTRLKSVPIRKIIAYRLDIIEFPPKPAAKPIYGRGEAIQMYRKITLGSITPVKITMSHEIVKTTPSSMTKPATLAFLSLESSLILKSTLLYLR
jgi:hypothetical protein